MMGRNKVIDSSASHLGRNPSIGGNPANENRKIGMVEGSIFWLFKVFDLVNGESVFVFFSIMKMGSEENK